MSKRFVSAFNRCVRLTRSRLGLSVEEAAKRAGVRKQTWYAWENQRTPPMEKLELIAKGLGCVVRLSFDEPPPNCKRAWAISMLKEGNMDEHEKTFRIALWDVAEEDFEAWQAFTDNYEMDFRSYHEGLGAIRENLTRSGLTVALVPCSVERMRSELQQRGWHNTPENRAAVLALLTLQ